MANFQDRAQASMTEARSFAADHLAECANEILEWRNTGLLRDGRIRELAAILRRVTPTRALDMAESIVTAEALRIISVRFQAASSE